jgi:hypothetical protein
MPGRHHNPYQTPLTRKAVTEIPKSTSHRWISRVMLAPALKRNWHAHRYKHAFVVLTHWAFKSAAVLAGRSGHNASEHHLSAALWAFQTYDGC